MSCRKRSGADGRAPEASSSIPQPKATSAASDGAAAQALQVPAQEVAVARDEELLPGGVPLGAGHRERPGEPERVPVQRVAGGVRGDRAPVLEVALAEREWQLTLGKQENVAGSTPGAAVLHGVAVGFAGERLSLQHADLGLLSIDPALVRRVDHADRARRALLPFDFWRSRPMAEPDSGAGLGGR